MSRLVAIALSAAAPAGALSLAAPSQAPRPALHTRACPRFIAGMSAARYVRVSGTGFTPGRTVSLTYSGTARRTHGDALRAGARGTIAGRIRGPRTLRRYVTPVTLRATEFGLPLRTVTERFSVVRLAVRVPRVTRPHAVVTFRLYGFPDHRVVWAHYFFGGRPVATARMGRTRGACGLVRHRGRYLPTRIRDGRWQLYLSLGRRFTRADARHRRFVLVGSFRVADRRYFARPRAAGAPTTVHWSPGGA